jgi:alcohol dehydrogenase class IV
VNVRWGLEALPELLASYEQPLLVSTDRWRDLALPVAERFHDVRSHAERAGVDAAIVRAQEAGAGALVGLGGGSAIDTAKAVSAATGLPLVAVPTTYAGAEWTPYFGIRDEAARVKGGGSGANTVGILYEPALTLGLSRGVSGGTAMNALAHCVEARYVFDSPDGNDGAALIDEWLPRVLEDGQDGEARRRLLEGAMHAGIALRDHGLYLGHAMAQALGGRYGLPHGALNAICLPAAMRFNGATEPIGVERVEELARLCGFTRLRDLEVPEGDLREIAEATAVRGGAQANPRPASVDQIEELLLSIW